MPCLRSTTPRGDNSCAWGLVRGPLLMISVVHLCDSRGALGGFSISLSLSLSLSLCMEVGLPLALWQEPGPNFRWLPKVSGVIRAVHRKPIPNPLEKTVRSGPSTGRPDADDGRWQFSASRTRNQQVGWWVSPPKIRKTWTDRWKPIIRWETQIPARKTQIPALFDNSSEFWDVFWLDLD